MRSVDFNVCYILDEESIKCDCNLLKISEKEGFTLFLKHFYCFYDADKTEKSNEEHLVDICELHPFLLTTEYGEKNTRLSLVQLLQTRSICNL